jgi:1-acyl-sn-glycerol-3-phosphate acyltransferase
MFPFFMLFSIKTDWHKYAYKLTNLWAKGFFPLALFKVSLEVSEEKSNGPVVFCANHFSYLDVATMPMVSDNACFVGKSSIKKVPIFGLFFKLLHISVDRGSIRDRARALQRNHEAIQQGKSLFIFPEGGIRSVTPPTQMHYKDGAFIIAINTGVPIVPVTIATNWIVLPDDGKFLLRSRLINMIVHPPIETEGMMSADLADLKQQVFDIIQSDLEHTRDESN